MRRDVARGVAAFALAGLIVAACGDDRDGNDSGSEPADETEDAAADTTAQVPALDAPSARELCSATTADTDNPTAVASADLKELSGVAISRQHESVLWGHNDSGYSAEIFALGNDGDDLGSYDVPEADSADWEDIALGRGPEDDVDYLFVADIGDNARIMADTDLREGDPFTIYRIPEPASVGEGGTTENAIALPFAYEDGDRDAETLMFDPLTDELLIVSKQWDGTASGVYPMPAEVVLATTAPDDTVTLERVSDVPETEGVFITGGDVSPDGRLIALRTYEGVWLWDRDPELTVGETLAESPACEVTVDETQGEAVAFSLDATGFVTIGEGDQQPILWHTLP